MTTIGELFQGRVCFEQTKLGQPYEFDARVLDCSWRELEFAMRGNAPFPPQTDEPLIIEPGSDQDGEHSLVHVFTIIDGYRRLQSVQLLFAAILHAAQRISDERCDDTLINNHACGPFMSFKVAPARIDEQSIFLVAMLRGPMLRTFRLDERGMPDIGLAYEYHVERLRLLLEVSPDALATLRALVAAIRAMPIEVVCAEEGMIAYHALNADALKRIRLTRRWTLH